MLYTPSHSTPTETTRRSQSLNDSSSLYHHNYTHSTSPPPLIQKPNYPYPLHQNYPPSSITQKHPCDTNLQSHSTSAPRSRSKSAISLRDTKNTQHGQTFLLDFSYPQNHLPPTSPADFKNRIPATCSSASIASSSETNFSQPRRTLPTLAEVNETTLTECYIRYVIASDPNVDDSAYTTYQLARKFIAVPRTEGKVFPVWDLFKLVSQLDGGEIKNWSQLVGKLGVEEATGRPQYAQRVKRWMQSNKIDEFFKFLLRGDQRICPSNNPARTPEAATEYNQRHHQRYMHNRQSYPIRRESYPTRFDEPLPLHYSPPHITVSPTLPGSAHGSSKANQRHNTLPTPTVSRSPSPIPYGSVDVHRTSTTDHPPKRMRMSFDSHLTPLHPLSPTSPSRFPMFGNGNYTPYNHRNSDCVLPPLRNATGSRSPTRKPDGIFIVSPVLEPSLNFSPPMPRLRTSPYASPVPTGCTEFPFPVSSPIPSPCHQHVHAQSGLPAVSTSRRIEGAPYPHERRTSHLDSGPAHSQSPKRDASRLCDFDATEPLRARIIENEQKTVELQRLLDDANRENVILKEDLERKDFQKMQQHQNHLDSRRMQ